MEEKIPLIETAALKKYFKVNHGKNLLHAVDDVTLRIEKGKTLGVVGESGCGKSMLGRCILRLIEPASGQILYNGEDILRYSSRKLKGIRQEMQIIFQDPYSSLDPRMSAAELIAEPMKLTRKCSSKGELNDRIDHLMETMGLSPRLRDAYPHELDGGRRQRIGVARALSVDPKFIVCDEPVSALDVSIQAQILNQLMDLQENLGLTYLFITHDLSVVKHISDDIAVMYLGQCAELASSQELFENPVHPYTQALLAAIPLPNIDTKLTDEMLLQGEVSNPVDPPPGCRFAPRCKYAADQCRCQTPELKDFNGHKAACFRV